MVQKQRTTTSGFTIVELLIVIVVIAILAAITIVSFNGVQNRARVTAIISEAGSWKSAHLLFQASTRSKPTPSTTDSIICLTDSFESDSRFNSPNSCASGNALSNSQDPSYKAALAEVAKITANGPIAPTFYSRYGRAVTYIRGIVYDKDSNKIMYALPGAGNSCGQGKSPEEGLSLGGPINPKEAYPEDNPDLTLCSINLSE